MSKTPAGSILIYIFTLRKTANSIFPYLTPNIILQASKWGYVAGFSVLTEIAGFFLYWSGGIMVRVLPQLEIFSFPYYTQKKSLHQWFIPPLNKNFYVKIQ